MLPDEHSAENTDRQTELESPGVRKNPTLFQRLTADAAMEASYTATDSVIRRRITQARFASS